MDTLFGLRWVEWFSLAMLLFTVGVPVALLILSVQRRHMQDLDCSKFEIFTTDRDIEADEQPHTPMSCEPRYLNVRPWRYSVNTGWVWLTLGIALVWVAIMLGVFFVSLFVPSLRQDLPM